MENKPIKKPEIVVFAGPNGSGKSTITDLLRPPMLPYVNADEIQRVLDCDNMEAAKIAEKRREDYLDSINVHEICSRNLRIIGMNNHTHTKYKTVMEMMLRNKDTFPWDRLFSHRYPLAETEQAIKTSITKESMKVLIDPWME